MDLVLFVKFVAIVDDCWRTDWLPLGEIPVAVPPIVDEFAFKIGWYCVDCVVAILFERFIVSNEDFAVFVTTLFGSNWIDF